MLRNASRADAEARAHAVRDRTRALGRSARATDWDADGMVYGDGDAICEQLLRFRDAGVVEVTVSVSSAEEILWFDDRVVRRIGGV
jgi:hypothetical protein